MSGICQPMFNIPAASSGFTNPSSFQPACITRHAYAAVDGTTLSVKGHFGQFLPFATDSQRPPRVEHCHHRLGLVFRFSPFETYKLCRTRQPSISTIPAPTSALCLFQTGLRLWRSRMSILKSDQVVPRFPALLSCHAGFLPRGAKKHSRRYA